MVSNHAHICFFQSFALAIGLGESRSSNMKCVGAIVFQNAFRDDGTNAFKGSFQAAFSESGVALLQSRTIRQHSLLLRASAASSSYGPMDCYGTYPQSLYWGMDTHLRNRNPTPL